MLEQELLAAKGAAKGELLSGRLKLTDMALLEEASRYPADPKLSFSLGLRVSSSSTLSLGPDEALLGLEGVSSGAEGSVEGGMDRIPLRVVRIEDLSALSG